MSVEGELSIYECINLPEPDGPSRFCAGVFFDRMVAISSMVCLILTERESVGNQPLNCLSRGTEGTLQC